MRVSDLSLTSQREIPSRNQPRGGSMETEVIWALAVPEASTPLPGFFSYKTQYILGGNGKLLLKGYRVSPLE